MQENEPGLFDLNGVSEVRYEEPLITDQQVDSIREAFANARIMSMEERQEIIESCTVRSIANIRELQAREVRRVLKRINDRKNSKGPDTGSSWDNRDEDTWIDKL